MNSPVSSRRAFTLVELLVSIAIIAILMALLFPIAGRAREASRRTVCASNMRQVLAALTAYSNAFDQRLPAYQTSTAIGQFLWDIPIGCRDQLVKYGAVRKIFYCPSNPDKNQDQFWTFSPDPQWCVTGYFFYIPRLSWNSAHLNATYPGTLTNGQPDPHHSQGQRIFPNDHGGFRPGETELITDAVMRVNGLWTNDGNMANQGNSTNHIKGNSAQGGNVGFHDGHVVWRSFDEMDRRLGPPLVTPEEYW